MGIRWQTLFPELNFSQFVNPKVKILGRRVYSPRLKDVAVLEVAELILLIFHTFVCPFFFARTASRHLSTVPNSQTMYGKLEKLTGRFLASYPSNLVNAIFYPVF